MVSSSRKRVVNGRATWRTTEHITGFVDFFMKREKGGDLELPS